MNAIVTPFLADGWLLLLPQDGDQTKGSLTVDGWNFQHPTNGGAAGFIFTLKGGIDPYKPFPPETFFEPEEPVDGDPVGRLTGNFKYKQLDISQGSSNSFPFRIGFSSHYNSGRRYTDGPLGLGWTHNWNTKSQESSDPFRALGQFSPIDAAASIAQMFVCIDLFDDSDPAIIKMMTTWLANAWWSDQLTNNTVIVSEAERIRKFMKLPDGSFNPQHGDVSTLIQKVDSTYELTSKHQEKMTFNSDGMLETWDFPFGVTISLTYSAGQLTNISNGMGRSFSISYNGDKISSVTDNASRTVQYGYDPDGQLISFTDTLSEVVAYSYEDLGLMDQYFLPEHPLDPVVSNTYDSLGRVESQFDPLGNQTKFYYAGWRSEIEDALSNSKVYLYNSSGKEIKRFDELGFETSSTYDGLDRLTNRVFPEGGSTTWTYDSSNNVLSVTRSAKPSSSLPDIVESFTYDAIYNKRLTATNGNGDTTTFTIEPATGNLLRIERPEVGGQIPTRIFTYNSRGQALTIQDPTGILTKLEYNSTTEELERVTVDEGVGRLNLQTQFTYNSWGDFSSVQDQRGNTQDFTFDSKRRLIQTVEPAPFNHVTNFTYDKNNNRLTVENEQDSGFQVWNASYNQYGQIVSLNDPLNNETVLEYDERRRLFKITDPEGRVTETQFDERGFPEKIIDSNLVEARVMTYSADGINSSVKDGNGNVTEFTYDGFNRLDKTIYPDGSFEQRSVYDQNSNILRIVTRANDQIDFTFDELNRITQRSPANMATVTFVYDLADRLLKASTPVIGGDPTTGDFEFFYDTAGRVTGEIYPDTKQFQYELDEFGNTTRVTYTDGYFVDREFDELNRLVGVKLNGETQDALGFEYDKLSRRTKLTYKNGNTVDYGYEPNNDIASMVHTFNSNPVTFTYGYNKVHQPVSQTVSDPQFMWHPEQTESVNYATANNLNQYPQVKSKAYSYDSKGNLGNNNDFTGFSYDTENHLVQAVKTGVQVDYSYDPFNRNLLLKHEKDSVVQQEEYKYARWQLLEEYEDGVLKFRYIFGSKLDEPLIRIRVSNNRHRYFHQDKNGSIIAHARADSVLAKVYVYSPFGDSPDMGGTTFGFTGQRYDGQTRLHNFRYRFYDRKIGRFLQPDPIGYGPGLNTYSYVDNNPLRFVDPLGLVAMAFGETNPGGTVVDPAPAADTAEFFADLTPNVTGEPPVDNPKPTPTGGEGGPVMNDGGGDDTTGGGGDTSDGGGDTSGGGGDTTGGGDDPPEPPKPPQKPFFIPPDKLDPTDIFGDDNNSLPDRQHPMHQRVPGRKGRPPQIKSIKPGTFIPVDPGPFTQGDFN